MKKSSEDMVNWTLQVRQKWAQEVGALIRKTEGKRQRLIGPDGSLLNTAETGHVVPPEIQHAVTKCDKLWKRYRRRDFRHTDTEVDAQEQIAQWLLRLNAERSGKPFSGWRLPNRRALSIQ